MPTIIATTATAKGMDHLDMDGLSGRIHRFAWNKEAGRYEYPTASQEEIDDLLGTLPVRGCLFPLTVIASDAIPAPAVKPSKYNDLDESELSALAKDCGIKVKGDDDRHTLMRLIGAYYIGAGLKK
jgi:hypothetical protein